MNKFILLLLLTSFSLFAQVRDVGSNPAASAIAIDYSVFTTPSGCTSAATIVAHEINVLNTDLSIAAFAYVDLVIGFTHTSNNLIVTANADGGFTITDATYTNYRTRVAQKCKMGCCHKTVKWTDWVYESSGEDPCVALANGDCSIDYDETYDIEENGAGGFDVSSVPNGTYTNADACYEYIYKGLYCLEDSKWVYITNNAVFGGPTPIPTDVLVCPIEADKTYQDIEVLKPIGFAEYWVLRGEFDIIPALCRADLEFNIEKNGTTFPMYNLTFTDTDGTSYTGLSPFEVSQGTYTFINQDVSAETGNSGDFTDFVITVASNCEMELSSFSGTNNIEVYEFVSEGVEIIEAGRINFSSKNEIIQGEAPDCGAKAPTIEQLNINCSSACTAFINYIEFCEPAPIPEGAETVGIDLYLNGTTLIENLEANSSLGGQISDGTVTSELTIGNDYSILLYYLDENGASIYSQSFALADSLNNACLPCNTAPVAEANNDAQGLLTVGVQYLINVTLNDTYLNCAPTTFNFGSLENCTVSSNDDGTFNVTPLSPGDWSFTYTTTCSDKTTTAKASVFGTASN